MFILGILVNTKNGAYKKILIPSKDSYDILKEFLILLFF